MTQPAARAPLKPLDYRPPLEPFLTVLHADSDILVVDKPSGLLSVPGKAADHADCLEARARERFSDARIVHRLDMDTSGVMILARNAAAHRHLGLQFERRKTQKTYVARVWGEIDEDEGVIDLPLICDWPNRPRQMVSFEHGKAAETRWRVLDRERSGAGAAITRVRMWPKTGRSHQLRVHMLSLGHPILGDNLYAPEEALLAADRLQLHAETLSLHHPDGGEMLTFTSPCPF